MGSRQSVPWDSPLAWVKWNLKPLFLTDLKVHKLESLCTQIWPQYKLDDQNHWPEFRTFDFNILSDLTNFLTQNGKWSEVPYIQVFWDLRSHPSLCKDCSTCQILCSLSPSITKESTSKARKRPPNLSAPDFDLADEPPPYHPERKLPETRPHPLALPPPKQEAMTPKPPKRLPPHPPSARTWSKHMLPLKEVAGPEGPTMGSCAFLNFWYEPNWRKIGIFLRKSY